MNIFDILTDDEIISIQKLTISGSTWSYIKSLLPAMSLMEISVVYDYYQKFLTRYGTSIHFGHKDEPYYTSENLEDYYPTYTWESLSEHEKEFYLNYGKTFPHIDV